MTREDAAHRTFLRALFPTEVGLVELRAPKRWGAQEFYRVGDENSVATFLRTYADADIYVGIATRRTSENGTLENCMALWALFVDIDFKATTEADARERLAAFNLSPSLVVHSGGGLHVYWCLREPFELPSEAAAAKSVLRRLAQHFGADLASAEAARVLRLPDGLNHKYNPPRPVILETLDTERRYNASEFDEWLPAETPTNGSGGVQPFAMPARIGEGERNVTLYRLGRSLHAKGLTPKAILAALHAESRERCDPPLPDEEVAAIAARAARQPNRPNFGSPEAAPATDPSLGLDSDALADATVVAAQGRQIAETGVPFVVEGVVPAYGMLGMLVAYAKVGKTSFALAMGAAVATGQPFLGQPTRQARVLVIAAEDPPEYTAWLARHFHALPRGAMFVYRRPLVLDPAGLAKIAATIITHGFGLVLIASWQAVVRGLIRDENDNAGAVNIVEQVKAFTRQTGIPWLIDAHSGKGEDQTDDADPSKAMRGASGASGAADYTLSLRYANGPFGSRRRFSGKGRFVSFAPLIIECDVQTGTYTVIGATNRTITETTWRLICETGALTAVPQTADAIARAARLTGDDGRVTTTGRRQVREALHRREGVLTTTEVRRGQQTTLYARSEVS